MVDITGKQVTKRSATAEGFIRLTPEILETLDGGEIRSKKGPVLATARIAGTMAVKNTSSLIPFCHPLPLDSIKFDLKVEDTGIKIRCTVKTEHKTGVEMEALTGVQVAALTIYDMCKAMSHDLVIEHSQLISKTGGKSDYGTL